MRVSDLIQGVIAQGDFYIEASFQIIEPLCLEVPLCKEVSLYLDIKSIYRAKAKAANANMSYQTE